MKRYAITTMIGTGAPNDPYRPAIAGRGINYSIAIAPDFIRGGKQWVFAALSGDETILIQLDSEGLCDLLPVGPENLEDLWVNVMTSQQRRQLSNRLNSRTGVRVDANHPGTLRDVLTEIGQSLDADFSVDSLFIL